MGNVYSGISDQGYYEAEKRMLEHTKIPIEKFKITDVVIDDKGTIIRTTEVGNKSKQTLVFFHGYGGAGVVYWRMMRDLYDDFNCIYLDILGMGASTRPNFDFKEPKEANEFLTDWVEKWRKAYGDITQFVLVGHSFGGYIAGMYAAKYWFHVKKLLLLSPLGISRMPDVFDQEQFIQMMCSGQPNKIMFHLTKAIYLKRYSPFAVMRALGRCSGCAIENYSGDRLKRCPEEEKEDFKKYLHQLLLRKGSTEYGLFICFDQYLFAYYPLQDDERLGKSPIPISIFFGDEDWMHQYGSDYIIENNQYKEHSHYYLVHDSDHNFQFDNPEAICKLIKEDLKNLHELVPLEITSDNRYYFELQKKREQEVKEQIARCF